MHRIVGFWLKVFSLVELACVTLNLLLQDLKLSYMLSAYLYIRIPYVYVRVIKDGEGDTVCLDISLILTV